MERRLIPLSIKIIGTLLIIDASLKIATIQLGIDMVLGFPLKGPPAVFFKVVYAGLLSFVGFGLWQLREVARQIGVYLQVYRIVDQFALLVFTFANWNPSASKYPPALSALVLASISLIPALVQGVILWLLLRKRSFFLK